MLTPNPAIQAQLGQAKQELALLKAEKTRLFPPNTDPLGTPNSTSNFSPALPQWLVRIG
ncbi:MAG: hypothetical protein IT331_08500 [Anaerolineae bacterium]|nr:hypothetical protein [Anaerolineae bacterium]